MPSPVSIKKLLSENADPAVLKRLLEEQAVELGKLKQELHDTRFHLNILLESAESVHYLINKSNPGKNFFSANWKKIFGFSPQDVADPMAEKSNLVLIDSLKEYEQKWEEFEKLGYALIKYQISRPQSVKIYWLEEEIFRKTDPYSQEEVWAGTIKDLSGIEFYKEYISESEGRFKNVTDSLPIMVWTSDEEDYITYVNESAQRFFQLDPSQKRKLGGLEQWVHPDYLQMVAEGWDTKADRREPIDIELLFKGPDDEFHFLAVKATPRFLKNGQFIGYIGVTLDLTNEYELKQQREKAYSALQESEEKYKMLFENMELGILEVDDQENIIYTNEAFRNIVGYTTKEMLGKKASTLLLADSRGRKIMDLEHEVRATGNGSVYELNIKRKNGDVARMIISGVPLFNNEGHIKGSVGIHWDVTDIRKIEKTLIEEKLKKEKELIEARHQAEDQQRAQIGHDLHDSVGQMLAYIGMYVGQIKSKSDLKKEEFFELERAIQNTLEQVRTLSRTLASPALADLGLRDSVRELIASYAILKKPVFELSLYTQREDYNLNLEKKMVVYRILQELLNNTFKYAEAEKVVLALYFKGKSFHMDYSDNGKGYDAETISRGVGLDSMRSRIAYYKGSLKLLSTPGQGSKAFLVMPIR